MTDLLGNPNDYTQSMDFVRAWVQKGNHLNVLLGWPQKTQDRVFQLDCYHKVGDITRNYRVIGAAVILTLI